MTEENADSQSVLSQVGSLARKDRANNSSDGLDRIREILFGEILVELEKRLARLDSYIANRTGELQQNVRHRTGVLEAHVRKELEAVAARAVHDSSEMNNVIRTARHEHRDALDQLELRIVRIEERLEQMFAKLERDTRDQLLAQANAFHEELERVRTQLRAALSREHDLETPAATDEGEHAETWTQSY